MLRRLGCRLPVQVWHLGPAEMDRRMKSLLAPLDVEFVDAFKVQKKFPVRILRGWELKPYAILHSPFREVLLLDADNVPITDPTLLFDVPPFKRTGAVFWPDYQGGKCKRAAPIWRSCGMRQPAEPEFETGQILLDKQRCWPALRLCLWFNENSDFYYQYLHGDKETFHLAFRKLRKSYSMVPVPVQSLQGIMCQHDFQGRRIFQHRNTDKWDLFLRNRRIRGFRFDKECRDYLVQLRRVWDGGMSSTAKNSLRMPARSRRGRRKLRFMAVMIPAAKQTSSQKTTLDNLARTDWGQVPLRFQLEDGGAETISRTARALRLSCPQAGPEIAGGLYSFSRWQPGVQLPPSPKPGRLGAGKNRDGQGRQPVQPRRSGTRLRPRKQCAHRTPQLYSRQSGPACFADRCGIFCPTLEAGRRNV